MTHPNDTLNTPSRNTNKLRPYPLGNTDGRQPPYKRIGTPVESCLHKLVNPHDTITDNALTGPGGRGKGPLD